MLSDKHCAISMSWSFKHDNSYCSGENLVSTEEFPDTHTSHDSYNTHPKWALDKAHSFCARCSKDIPMINNLLENIDLHNTQQNHIDNIVNTISSTFEACAQECDMIKHRRNKATNKLSNRKRNCDHKPWYTDECETMRKLYASARNEHRRSGNEQTKLTLKLTNKKYKKTLKHEYNIYHKELNNKLRNLKSSNPKEYWSMLSLKKSKTPVPEMNRTLACSIITLKILILAMLM